MNRPAQAHIFYKTAQKAKIFVMQMYHNNIRPTKCITITSDEVSLHHDLFKENREELDHNNDLDANGNFAEDSAGEFSAGISCEGRQTTCGKTKTCSSKT